MYHIIIYSCWLSFLCLFRKQGKGKTRTYWLNGRTGYTEITTFSANRVDRRFYKLIIATEYCFYKSYDPKTSHFKKEFVFFHSNRKYSSSLRKEILLKLNSLEKSPSFTIRKISACNDGKNCTKSVLHVQRIQTSV